MIRISGLLFVLSLTALAQPGAYSAAAIPQDGLNAMHCIKSGDRDWLSPPLSEARTLRFGFGWDRRSNRGQSHLIVVVYEDRSKGQVLDLLEEHSNGQLRITVVNNGSFRMLFGKVDMDELLGGVWTYEYLQRNVRSILKQQVYSTPISTLLRRFPGVACSSYVEMTSGSKQ